MASYNRPPLLARTLRSIRDQSPAFAYEIIVVDDGSEGHETASVCERFGVRYFRTERRDYRNPGPARNIGYRAARGHVIVCQSDDTYHETPDSLDRLVTCHDGEMLIATVWELDEAGQRKTQYTGPENRRPFFFLGSVLRDDLYAVGGDDEDFSDPGFDDDWLAARLVNGRGLTPNFRTDIVGCHQWHARPPTEQAMPWFYEMRALYGSKMLAARASGAWVSASGPWEVPICSG